MVLVGPSLGGAAAIDLAVAHPDAVRGPSIPFFPFFVPSHQWPDLNWHIM